MHTSNHRAIPDLVRYVMKAHKQCESLKANSEKHKVNKSHLEKAQTERYCYATALASVLQERLCRANVGKAVRMIDFPAALEFAIAYPPDYEEHDPFPILNGVLEKK